MFDDIPINDEMLYDIYSEEVLDDFYKMTNVLYWFVDPKRCYMSSWNVTDQNAEKTLNYFERTIGEEYYWDEQVRYSLIFTEKVGPLAMLSKDWYAEMLETYAA